MSVLKELGTKRFWLAIALTVGVALLVCAVCAYATVLGLTGVHSSWLWVCLAWLVGTFIGGRFAAAGRERVLLRSLLNAALSVGILWALGLTTSEMGESATHWWQYLASALVGAVLAAALPQRKRGRSKKKGREASRVTIGR